jgi:hypothetical protein
MEEVNLVGEAYLSIGFSDTICLSDTGRDWTTKYCVKDNPSQYFKKELINTIGGTEDLITIIKKSRSQ